MSEDYYEEEDFDDGDEGYGFCPLCGSPMTNTGAESRGDGDLYDAIRCTNEWCEYEGYDEHAKNCHCPDCDPYFSPEDDDDGFFMDFEEEIE